MGSSDNPCSTCGTPIPASAPGGQCPRCLLGMGLASGTDGGDAAFALPTPEELAGLFPQLRILGLVGRGGVGAVYRAIQVPLDRPVALKILSPERAADPAFGLRFAREARALAKLVHPNIVTVHDFGGGDDLPFLLMEYVDGTNLRQMMDAGRLRPDEALRIVREVCDALEYAHGQGVVHRDIKPENILIDRQGRVKIADFGLAKVVGDAARANAMGATGVGQVVGTPHYMAPEQIERPLEVDCRADLFALGVLLYELLTGELPLGRFLPPSRKAAVSGRLDRVVLRALEQEPARRYQNASDIKVALDAIARSGPKREAALISPWLLAAVGAGAVGAVALVAGMTLRAARHDHPPSCPPGMVLLAGGQFRMGERGDAVTVRDYCLDRGEATVDDWNRCVTDGRCRFSAATVSFEGVYASGEPLSRFCNAEQPGRGSHPMNCVDAVSAAQLCAARGAVLPTEEEWEWAARGADRGSMYPWGNQSPEGHACYGRSLTPPEGSADAGTCAVGQFPSGDTPSGLHDLAGNVWEWTSSTQAEGAMRVIRGGSWNDAGATITSSLRLARPQTFRSPRLGFRCAATPR